MIPTKNNFPPMTEDLCIRIVCYLARTVALNLMALAFPWWNFLLWDYYWYFYLPNLCSPSGILSDTSFRGISKGNKTRASQNWVHLLCRHCRSFKWSLAFRLQAIRPIEAKMPKAGKKKNRHTVKSLLAKDLWNYLFPIWGFTFILS